MTKKFNKELYDILTNSEHTRIDDGEKIIPLKSMEGIESELWFFNEIEMKYLWKELMKFKPRIPNYLDKLQNYRQNLDDEWSLSDAHKQIIDNHEIEWCVSEDELNTQNIHVNLKEKIKNTQLSKDYENDMFEPIVCLPSDELARDLMGIAKRRERKKIEKEFKKRYGISENVSLF